MFFSLPPFLCVSLSQYTQACMRVPGMTLIHSQGGFAKAHRCRCLGGGGGGGVPAGMGPVAGGPTRGSSSSGSVATARPRTPRAALTAGTSRTMTCDAPCSLLQNGLCVTYTHYGIAQPQYQPRRSEHDLFRLFHQHNSAHFFVDVFSMVS